MKFWKYHGAGNDFVLLENTRGRIKEASKPELAKKLCHRHLGIGGDGLLLVERSKIANAKMRIFNPDGSEAEMCGNGVRCFAKHVYERGIARKKKITIETLAGVKTVELTLKRGVVTYVRVDMGRPEFERGKIPARGEGKFLSETIELNGNKIEISAVNTGVPHAVIFVESIDDADVTALGRAIRRCEIFPVGANVNFVQTLGRNTFKIRTYERGVEDETLACGTGICAAASVAVALEKAAANSEIELQAMGGTIFVDVEKKGGDISRVFMRGPVSFVFSGEIEV